MVKLLDRLKLLVEGDEGLEQAVNAIALTSFITGALLTLGVLL